MLTLALDAMGGDQAPDMVVEAIKIVSPKLPHVHFLLYGDEALITPLLNTFPTQIKNRVTFIPTTEVIGPDVKPSAAVRGFRESSMYQAIRAVMDGKAAGVVSAGNTGAYMALSMFAFRMVADISRPAIATVLPTMKGASVVLDLGANVSCDAENLVQFAVMGSVLASLMQSKKNPSVGLLNIGSEDLKGHDVLKVASQTLRTADNINFFGFVEGDDIAKGTVDVVVTDGFTGNVALKTAEGVASMMSSFTKDAFKSSWLAKLGYILARKPFQALKDRLDPRYHNGAIFIGLNHVAVKSHGGTDAIGYANAIRVTANIVENNLNERIVTELNRLAGNLSDKASQNAV